VIISCIDTRDVLKPSMFRNELGVCSTCNVYCYVLLLVCHSNEAFSI
jgi:hypothetical protein